MAALGLRGCVRAFSGCSEQGLLFVVVRKLLIAVVSLVVEHGLWVHRLSSCGLRALERRLSSCGARTQLLRGMWDLPGPGLEPVSPALAGGFLIAVPPGKPPQTLNTEKDLKNHLVLCFSSLFSCEAPCSGTYMETH